MHFIFRETNGPVQFEANDGSIPVALLELRDDDTFHVAVWTGDRSKYPSLFSVAQNGMGLELSEWMYLAQADESAQAQFDATERV